MTGCEIEFCLIHFELNFFVFRFFSKIFTVWSESVVFSCFSSNILNSLGPICLLFSDHLLNLIWCERWTRTVVEALNRFWSYLSHHTATRSTCWNTCDATVRCFLFFQFCFNHSASDTNRYAFFYETEKWRKQRISNMENDTHETWLCESSVENTFKCWISGFC